MLYVGGTINYLRANDSTMDSKSLPASTEEWTEKYLPAVTEALTASQDIAKKKRKVPISGVFYFTWEDDCEGTQYVAIAFDPATTPEQLCQKIFPKYERNNTLRDATHIQIRFIVDGEEIAMRFPGGEDYPMYSEDAAPLVKLPAWSAD